MAEVAVYDPPMGCLSGYCGPDGEDALTAFEADLDWLSSNGVAVERYNLGHQPGAFAGNPSVRSLLQSEGMQCLPLVIVNGVVAHKGGYPSRRQLIDTLAGSGGDIFNG